MLILFLFQVTAFPRSRTLVTGLYSREKYKTQEPEVDPWKDLDYKG
jgi:hypothetical protein